MVSSVPLIVSYANTNMLGSGRDEPVTAVDLFLSLLRIVGIFTIDRTQVEELNLPALETGRTAFPEIVNYSNFPHHRNDGLSMG